MKVGRGVHCAKLRPLAAKDNGSQTDPMTDFVIRPARPEDAPALTRAIVAAYAVHDGRGLTLPPVADGVPEAIADNGVQS